MSTSMRAVVAAAACAAIVCGTAACDGGSTSRGSGDRPAPGGNGAVGVQASALSTGSCSDEGTPVRAGEDIESATIRVRGTDPQSGEEEVLAERSIGISGGEEVVLPNVPEGDGHELTFFAEGSQASWFGRHPDVSVRQGRDNVIELLLTRFGSFDCVPFTDSEYSQVVLPATAELGDGRILLTGGFRSFDAEATPRPVLGSPTSRAVIFDPRTGKMTNPCNGNPDTACSMGDDEERAGHTATFIPARFWTEADEGGEDGEAVPGSEGKVLIAGGARELEVRTDGGFPLRLPSGAARNDYLLYDVATRSFEPSDEAMELSRVLAEANRLTNGMVVLTGGGQWPSASKPYKQVALFDPQRGSQSSGPVDPGFRTLQGAAFEDFVARSGHTSSFLRTTEDNGLKRFLLWGGSSGDTVASVLKPSSQERGNVSGGFDPVTINRQRSDGVPQVWFHEMTRLEPALSNPDAAQRPQWRFLLTGGAREGDDGLSELRDDEAWLIAYCRIDEETGNCTTSNDPGRTQPTVVATRVPGLGSGRVFHSAVSPDGRHVTVLGGWQGTTAVEDQAVRFFDREHVQGQGDAWTAPPEQSQFTPRGGLAGPLLDTHAMLLAGGEQDLQQLGAEAQGVVLELYTPSNTPRPQQGSDG